MITYSTRYLFLLKFWSLFPLFDFWLLPTLLQSQSNFFPFGALPSLIWHSQCIFAPSIDVIKLLLVSSDGAEVADDPTLITDEVVFVVTGKLVFGDFELLVLPVLEPLKVPDLETLWEPDLELFEDGGPDFTKLNFVVLFYIEKRKIWKDKIF